MRLLRFQRKLDEEKGAELLGLSLQVNELTACTIVLQSTRNGIRTLSSFTGLSKSEGLTSAETSGAALVLNLRNLPEQLCSTSLWFKSAQQQICDQSGAVSSVSRH